MNVVREKFGKHLHGVLISNISNKRTYAYIISADKQEIGYIQAYNARDFTQENALDLGSISGALCGVDLFIGDLNYVHKGIGPLILNEFERQILAPHFDWCLIDPAANNKSAIKAFEKAGFKIAQQFKTEDIIWMIKGL